VICYCDDCQAFAEYLQRAGDVLDARGGSDIVQTAPRYVDFAHGREHLACVRLTPKGVLRWYAACCRTPIGNTPANPKLAFVGLLHNCLGTPAELDERFGPPRMRVFTAFAKGEPKPKRQIPIGAGAVLAWHLATARFAGAHRPSPFFDRSGHPIADPISVPKAAERRY
jgi:hypothetical protein